MRARVLLTGRQLPEEFGRKVLFGQDLSVMERLQELEAMDGLFYEIASQTRAPLSMLAVWLKRLRTDATEREVDILDKATRQLHKLEITYDRMLLYDDRAGLIPFTPAPLDMAELLETALGEFTDAERQAIRRDIPAVLPRVRGDIYQLSFIVETILSFLLRFAPEDEPVGIALSAAPDGGVDMVIRGRLPAHAPAPRAEVELALGERIIRRFVDQHGGRYDPPKAGREHACFRLWLPAAS
jgi:signal transduction histidine kinase